MVVYVHSVSIPEHVVANWVTIYSDLFVKLSLHQKALISQLLVYANVAIL